MNPTFESLDLTFRPITPEDYPFTLKIYRAIRGKELELTNWNEEQKMGFCDMQLRLMNHHYETHHPDKIETIVHWKGEPVARLIIIILENEVRLGDLMILPEYQNNGICTAIMRHWVAEGIKLGKPIRLHVERTNRAINLYQREKFQIVGESDTHYLMEWTGTPEEARALAGAASA